MDSERTRHRENHRKIGGAVIISLLLGLTALALFTDAEGVALRWLQERLDDFHALLTAHPVLVRAAYISLFVLFIGCYLPGGILFLLLSGALFSFWEGLVLASFANLAGAVVGFLLSRCLLYDTVHKRYPKQITRINAGLTTHGIVYLLLLRVAPIIPSPVVNVVMGVTDMPLRTYAWVTLLGRIPMTVIYVKLGAGFADVRTLSDLLSFDILLSLSLLCALIIGGSVIAQKLRCRQRVA